jgi:hypothetical protein
LLGVTYEPLKFTNVALEARTITSSTQNWHSSTVEHDLVALARPTFQIRREVRSQWLDELSVQALRQKGDLFSLELAREVEFPQVCATTEDGNIVVLQLGIGQRK